MVKLKDVVGRTAERGSVSAYVDESNVTGGDDGMIDERASDESKLVSAALLSLASSRKESCLVGRGVMKAEGCASGESTSVGAIIQGLEDDVSIDVGCGEASDVCSTTAGKDSSKIV